MKNRLFEILLGFALAMGVYACWPDPDPTIAEWQQYLNDKGYPCVIDGRLGKETEASWNAMCRDNKK